MELQVLMPVYNDWQSAERLLQDLDRVAADHEMRFSATLVDDGSTESVAWPPEFRAGLASFSQLEILHLQGNRGQSMAVTVGLAHLLRQEKLQPVLLMDADGQDRAVDVPALVAAFREDPGRLVLAERRHRPEGPLFRVCYGSFQVLFRLLVGRSFRIGLFGIYPVARIEALLRHPGLPRHVAGTVIASGLAERFVETDRGRRYYGESRFGLRGHIRHAWNALVVNRARILARLSRASGIAGAVLLAATALRAVLSDARPLDSWTIVGLALAMLCGLAGFALARSLRPPDPETTATPLALCAEHVASVGILRAPAATTHQG